MKNSRVILLIVLIFSMPLLWPAYPWLLSFQSGGEHSKQPPREKIRISDFSPSGKKVYLDYCDHLHNCRIGWLDLAANKSTLFIPQDTRDVIASPSSSDDGSKLAVIVKEAANDYKSSQVAILDLKTNTYRVITHSYGLKEWPSFSHDGKKIIYAQAGRLRTGGKTRFSEWDIYEIELASRTERQLTNFCFFLIDRPMYMRDNKRFVFSGEEPSCNYPDPNTSRSHGGYNHNDFENAQKGRALYKQRYQGNTVFIMSGNESTIRPVFVNGEYSGGAFLSRDGKKIFFTSITNKMDNSKDFTYHYDLFVSEAGVIRRLSQLGTLITGYATSASGEYIFFESNAYEQRPEYWLMNTVSGVKQRVAVEHLGVSSTLGLVRSRE